MPDGSRVETHGAAVRADAAPKVRAENIDESLHKILLDALIMFSALSRGAASAWTAAPMMGRTTTPVGTL